MRSSLPLPDSEELRKIIGVASTRAVYRVLYENRDRALAMPEIRQLSGLDPQHQEHLNRRLRDLDSRFTITRKREGTKTLYQLIEKREVPLNTEGISNKLRAWVLRNQRCVQCGKTPA